MPNFLWLKKEKLSMNLPGSININSFNFVGERIIMFGNIDQ